MDTVTENAYAKLNLTLDIVGESRGFHLLDMLVTSISLHDTVTVTERADGRTFCFMDGVAQTETNSAVRAARLITDTFKTNGFDINIEKRIPMAGGLGGSTADGVAVIRAAAKILGLPAKKITAEWLLNLGSDAPCMYTNGFKRVRGIGEKVDFIDINMPYKIGFTSGDGVDTKRAYALFDSMNIVTAHATERVLADMDKQYFDVADYLGNDLFAPACVINPMVKIVYNKLKNSGAAAVNMSGSGSTVYGLYTGDLPAGVKETAIQK